MKKTRTIRIICVIALLLLLLFMSLDILLPRKGDAGSGRTAVCFVHDGLMFPQMDYSQLFSHLDIESFYVIDSNVSKTEMAEQVKKIADRKKTESVILVCEGDYADEGIAVALENTKVSDLVLLSPELQEIFDLSLIGTSSPSCRVAIFSDSGKAPDELFERLSGEDTSFTRGFRGDSSAPELYLSADANRYYARVGSYKDAEVGSVVTMNSPVLQTYLANYLKNHVLGEKGISRTPLWTWVTKTVCTVLALIAFFLYASTFPGHKKFMPETHKRRGGAGDGATGDSGAGTDPAATTESPRELERGRKGKLRGRSIAEKYKSTLNHLLALQLLLGVLFSLPALIFVFRKSAAFTTVLLIWVCFSFLSSAFFLMPYIRKLRGRKVRSNRSMWPIHMAFTILLAADIFMLTLLWKGAGFLKPDLLLLVAVVLSVMLFVSMTMLQLTDNFFGKIQGSGQSVLDSVKFSAIRFVPMVIVFSFSIIMGRGVYAVQVILLSASLLGASYLRRVVRRGAFGEVLSLCLFAALYWMMF